jgi:nucleoside-diphosphate-sugar epimerase
VAKENPSIKTALVLPPIIYGVGEGPINQRSIQVPTLCKVALERGKAIRLGKGEGRWGNIHIRDLGTLFLALTEVGAKGNQDDAIWGDNGIYLTGIGEIVSPLVPCREERNPLKLTQTALGRNLGENWQGGSREGTHQHIRSRADR